MAWSVEWRAYLCPPERVGQDDRWIERRVRHRDPSTYRNAQQAQAAAESGWLDAKQVLARTGLAIAKQYAIIHDDTTDQRQWIWGDPTVTAANRWESDHKEDWPGDVDPVRL